MRKSVKKLLVLATAAAMTFGTVSLAACAGNFTTPSGIPSGTVESNGGFVVSVKDSSDGYYYFINGVETYTSDNTYGAPVKGALMRVKQSDVAAKKNNAEIVIPSLMVAGDYTAGIFIYGDRVYYATPTNVRNTSGVIENTYLDFQSAKLDGTDIKQHFRLSSNTTVYRFVEVEGTVYAIYAEGSSSYTLHSYNTKTGTDTVLAQGVTSYLLDSTNKENPYLYYAMGVTLRQDSDNPQSQLYNQVYRVRADATEAPYDYKWDQSYLDENNGGKPYYVNLGEIVLDGIGGNDKYTENFNHGAADQALSPFGYTYTLRSYKNGGIYFTRTGTNGTGGELYFLEEKDLAANWDSIAANNTVDTSFDKLANALDAANKATDAAYFYRDGNGAHHYLYVESSNLFRADINEAGEIVNDLEVAYDVGSATIVDIDTESDPDYDYVYFTRTNSAGLSVERAVFNGTEENYKDLNYRDENGVVHDNTAFRSVKVLDIQHVSGWYNYEIINGNLFYADAETFGGNAYSYVSTVNLNKGDRLMNNLELKEFNDLYQSVVDTSDKTVGLFAKLNDAFGDSDLSNAIKYYFYTGETESFTQNIADAVSYGQKETSLYTEKEKEAFAAFTADDRKGYSLDGKEIFGDQSYVDAEGNSYRVYSYFRTKLGKMSAADEETYANYWKNSALNKYTPPATEEEGLAWWAWLLIGLAIAIAVAAAVLIPVLIFVKKRKPAEETVRRKVDTTDNREIDVYAAEPEAAAEPETATEPEPETETAPEEEPAEETEPAAEPTEPAAESEPAAEPTEPAAEAATEPAAEPTEPEPPKAE